MTVKRQNNKVITKNGRVSCSCCELPPPVVLFFEYKYSGTYCENTCGEQSPLTLGQTYEDISTVGIDGPCPYDVVFRIEGAEGGLLIGDPCAYYTRFRRQDDYTVVLTETELGSGVCEFPFFDKIEDYITRYTATATGVDQNSGTVLIDCNSEEENLSGDGGYPGNSRSGFDRYTNEITTCPVIFTDYPEEWNSSSNVIASSQRSKSGNLRVIDKVIFRIPLIPSGISVTIKKTIQKYELESGSCFNFIAGEVLEIFEPYTGQETEFDPDELLQEIQAEETEEGGTITTFGVDVTLTIISE